MSDEDISLVLNTLIYKDSLNANQSNKNVYDIVFKLKETQLSQGAPGANPLARKDGDMYMTDAEWISFYNYVIQNKKTFEKVVIDDVTVNYNNLKGESDNFDKQMCVSANGKTFAVYRGTGNQEWHDNAEGMLKGTDLTQQQQTALDYFDNKVKEIANGGKIVVTGHSKGGNKTLILGILRGDDIEHAYSFDGQGVNPTFYKKYLKLIRQNQDKITSISAKNDYVNILGIKVTDPKYTGHKKDFLDFFGMFAMGNTLSGSVWEALGQHSPYAMYESGTYSNEFGSVAKRRKTDAEQDTTINMMSELAQYAMLNMKDEDFNYMANLLMHMIEPNGCSGDFDLSKMPEGFMERSKETFYKFAKYRLGLNDEDAKEFVSLMEAYINNTAFGVNVGGLFGIILGATSGKKAYDTLMNFLKKHQGGMLDSDTERDYTQKAQDDFLKIVDDVAGEPFYDFRKWDVWARLENTNAKITLDNCGGSIETYYNKMIDMGDVTRTQANKIFDDVYKRDSELCETLSTVNDGFLEIEKLLSNIADKVNGIVG